MPDTKHLTPDQLEDLEAWLSILPVADATTAIQLSQKIAALAPDMLAEIREVRKWKATWEKLTAEPDMSTFEALERMKDIQPERPAPHPTDVTRKPGQMFYFAPQNPPSPEGVGLTRQMEQLGWRDATRIGHRALKTDGQG